ncbi:MAG: helicase-related protein [Alphaproteobacteria bacterium]|nr:helicase-related protein [Alphaproteobacteria bacterium]
MSIRPDPSRIRAVLGPTNTGKTYLAMDRMLGHATGMIGFPLRLLARENYDRIVAAKGRNSVALVTGEEKIVPPRPRWFVCTVESMPLDRPVEFLAIDEIQLAADPERGHIFTDRLLHARGLEETMFLGSDTIRPLLKRLVPSAQIEGRPRFSTLSYSGEAKLARLPRRSAVVVFSVDQVYAIAETMRRQRGGTAVVLGALSPRTRNAQVEMYQAGEVDYMVATDAIGMGLNMDIDHVAFAGLRKFDGKRARPLAAAEIAQIAGRAGRHMSDGTFGTTNNMGGLDDEMVDAVEAHRFDPVEAVFWRNRLLDFSSPRGLVRSLEMRPAKRYLMRPRDADDHVALAELARDEKTASRATNPAAVRLLWEVCQIPDFRKVMPDHHAALLRQVYLHLTDGGGRLPEDWVAKHINRLDNIAGDIDTLTSRLAHIRTWTYISHRGDWLTDSQHWQERGRAIEDRLSDALHDRLLQRFVDIKAAALGRRRGAGGDVLAAVTAKGQVVVEGHTVGAMAGLAFRPLEEPRSEGDRAIISAARPALQHEIAHRVGALVGAPDVDFRLADDGSLIWRRAPVARLAGGDDLLRPRVLVLRNDLLDGAQRERVRSRIAAWLDGHLRRVLRPLYRLLEAGDLNSAARGLAFQLCEGLGSLPRRQAASQIRALGREDRQALARLGVRLGAESIYLKSLLKPDPLRLRALLWAAGQGEAPLLLPGAGDETLAGADAPAGFWAVTGYCVMGARALRVDRAEALSLALRKRARQGGFQATAELTALAGCEGAAFESVVRALGYRAAEGDGGTRFEAAAKGAAKKPRRRTRRKRKTQVDSPFAELRKLVDKRG